MIKRELIEAIYIRSLAYLLCFCMAYLLVSAMWFQVANPTANGMQVITHIGDVLKWKKLDKFQGN